jgi:hypothetical protein
MEPNNEKSKAAAQIERIRQKDPDLINEYEEKKNRGMRTTESATRSITPVEETAVAEDIAVAIPPELLERREEAIVLSHLRPVLIIRDNQVVPEFSGPDVSVWKDRLMEKKSLIDGVIPSVGRVEVRNNALYKWVGTGWLVDTDIIVTNRHVASVFCQNREGFAFKIGFPSGFQSSNMDFLEEHQRAASLEFDIESVLWIAENDTEQPDVAFMRIKRIPNGPALPKPIPLADSINEGEVVVTIGYPARDPSIPDQDTVLRIFGNVYDKKRLAPGEIVKVEDHELEHDCSTFGGNSGSVLFSLTSGKAVGLHFAGLYMQANYAVPATVVNTLLQQLREGRLPRMKGAENAGNNTPVINQPNTTQISPMLKNPSPGVYTIEANIPIKVSLEIGGTNIPLVPAGFPPGSNGTLSLPPTGTKERMEQAVALAKQTLAGHPGIINIEPGYRFRRGWITDEEVVVVEVKEKLDFPALRASGQQLIPQEFLGIGVDVRTAGLAEQLFSFGIPLPASIEEVPRPGSYREPPRLQLKAVKERMKAVFHVSPDSGWPNLKAFISRIEGRLTATMYEWEAPHISDALFKALRRGRLKMVTQRSGTKGAVEEMKQKLRDRFEHVWASTGAGGLITSAYHIKVASRDEKEFWLSSGNWKDSNQADIDPAGDNSTLIGPLRQHNREWNVVIENEKLAKLFQKYIEWDFEEALRVPLEEAVEEQPIYLFVPEAVFAPELERRGLAQYFDPLVIDRELNVQPLLTPDRNSRGQRMFLEQATKLIDSATSTIDIENQSFTLLDENDPQFERFFTVLRRKQRAGLAIRIIFRDPREFGSSGAETLQKVLSRHKRFGLDTDNMKVQKRCHTKAIIVDSELDDTAAVLFGSHNLTNTGSLFNRDASLIVRDKEVAQYFQKIFNFDWEVLAVQSAEESIGGVRVAGATEETPAGFRKVSLKEFLGEG